MIRPNIFIILFLSIPSWSGNKFVCPCRQTPQTINYRHILPISGFQNDCFFNAVRHFGIPISREILLQRLQERRDDRRWQNAVSFMAQQELSETNLQEPVPNHYDWLIGQIENHIPMPFRGYDENAPEDIIDLLGEEFRFDIRIVQRPITSSFLQIIRDFRHPPTQNIQRITLLYTSGEIGHFDVVIDENTLRAQPSLQNLYRLQTNPIGGAQGQVYAASHDTHQVAVKLLTLANENARQLAHQERTVLAECNHEFVLRYVESISLFDKSGIAIMTEWIDGQDLHDYLENKVLSPESIMRIFIPILLGLEYLHAQHVIHRDIKLANIMRAENGTIKICDFGFAKKSSQINHTHGCSAVTEWMGTTHNIAPEIWSIAGEYGQAADLWAAGISLYHLLEGQYPYQGQTRDNIKSNIQYNSPRVFRRTTNLFLQELFHALCQKKPADRLTAQQALDRIAQSEFGYILEEIKANLKKLSKQDQTR